MKKLLKYAAVLTLVLIPATLLLAQQEVVPTADSNIINSAFECVILATASTNATLCKNGPGNIYGFEAYNATQTIYYLRFYNLAAAPTCSAANGFIRSVPIPPAQTAAGGSLVGGVSRTYGIPVSYSTGIGFCITGGAASTDNTNAAVGVYGAIDYK